MQVITPYETMGSGHCMICERGIDKHTQTMVVDTLFDIELPGHYLDGRKYVCQGCVSDIVRTCGLMQATEVVVLKEQLDTFQAGYQAFLTALRENQAALNSKLDGVPVVPNVAFANPVDLVVRTEAIENSKPKRGRPAKEPF